MPGIKRVKKKTDKIREVANIKSHGFVELIDGLKEIKPKSNHVYSHDVFDNVHLKGGFTTCFWIYVDRVGGDKESSILYQWRNASEYDFRVGIKNAGIFLEVRNQGDETERILSEKKISSKKWYNM